MAVRPETRFSPESSVRAEILVNGDICTFTMKAGVAPVVPAYIYVPSSARPISIPLSPAFKKSCSVLNLENVDKSVLYNSIGLVFVAPRM